MRIGVYQWQFDEDYPGAPGFDDAALPVSEMFVKAADGLTFMSAFDNGIGTMIGDRPWRVDSEDAVRRIRDLYAVQGIALLPWMVPHGRWEGEGADYAIREGALAARIAIAAAADGQPPRILLDIEPHYHTSGRGFWRDDLGAGPREIDDFCFGYSQVAGPGALIDLAPDARIAHLPPVSFAHWCGKRETSRVHPQVYYADFVAPREPTIADARAALANAIHALGVNGWTRQDTIRPTFNANGPASVLASAIAEAHMRGLGRPSVWRRGIMPTTNAEAVAALADPWHVEPGPEPQPDELARLREELAAARLDLNAARGTVAAVMPMLTTSAASIDEAARMLSGIRNLGSK